MILRTLVNRYRLAKLKQLFLRCAEFKNIDTVTFFVGASIYLFGDSNKSDIQIGDNCLIYGTVASENHGKIKIGEYCSIGAGTKIRCVDSIVIGAYTAISYNVVIADNNSHPVNPHDRLIMRVTPPGSLERRWVNSDHAPIIIGRNCWIGENARICKGVTIGDGSIVAANTVVTKSVPANCIVAGNPGRIVKTDIDTGTEQKFRTDDLL